MEKELQEGSSQIQDYKNEIIGHKLSKENAIRIREIVDNELRYYKEFAKRIRALNYDMDISETSEVPVGLLDTIFKAIEHTVKDLRHKTSQEGGDQQDEPMENEEVTRLKEIISDYNDKYTKVIDRKNQFIGSLQKLIEKQQQKMSEVGDIDISQSEDYIKLQEIKKKDQESYETEIKVLKQKIVDTEGMFYKFLTLYSFK